MSPLLDIGNAHVLARIAASRSLLAFDFDGTLAPIVEERDTATMRPSTAALFARLCDVFTCAVISGRSRADVVSRLETASPRFVIGNHGAEPKGASNGASPEIRQVSTWLDDALAGIAGIDVEVKELSLAIHYRHAPDPDAAGEAVGRAIAAVPVPVRLIPGHKVWNIVSATGPSKADALLAARAASRAEPVMYVGDDVTDEDVFAIPSSDWLVTVRVGESDSSSASYFLRSQLEIDRLLGSLLALREQPA